MCDYKTEWIPRPRDTHTYFREITAIFPLPGFREMNMLEVAVDPAPILPVAIGLVGGAAPAAAPGEHQPNGNHHG